MSNAGRPQISYQGQGEAAVFYQQGMPLYGVPQGQRNALPHVEERISFSTTNATITAGNKIRFAVDYRMDLSKEWYLQLTRTAGTHPTSTTNPNTPHTPLDFEGFRWINQYEILYANKSVYRKTGEQMLDDLNLLYTEKERAGIAEMTAGYLSVAERQNRYAQAQTYTVPLQVPWRKRRNALPHHTLPGDIIVEITLNTVDQVYHQAIQIAATSGGTAPTFSATSYIICDCVHLMNDQKAAIYQQVGSAQGAGYKLKFLDYEYQLRDAITLTSLATNADYIRTLKLPNLRNTGYLLRAKLRYQQHLDSRTYLADQCLPIRSIVLNDQNKSVTPTFQYIQNFNNNTVSANSVALYVDNVARFPFAPVGWFNHCIAFCPNELVLDSENNCNTGRTMAKYSSPELVVTFDVTLGQRSPFPEFSLTQYPAPSALSYTLVYLDITLYAHNLLTQQNGDFRKIFRI